MPTYTIVSSTKDPLGPNEIHSGQHITVADGDVFIIDDTANANITFQNAGGGVPDIEIQMNESNANSFFIKVDGDIATDMTVANGVNASDVKLDAKAGNTLAFEAGDNVSFGAFEGSVNSTNLVLIGDNFSTGANWKFGLVDDVLIVGDNGTFQDIDAMAGNDNLTFGNDATVHHVDGKEGDDTLTFGMGLTGANIKGSQGNDTFNIGANAVVDNFDGGTDTDTMNTKSPSSTQSNFETTNVVCFGNGTIIQTVDGPVAVETLNIGQGIVTSDHGVAPLRWIGCTPVDVTAQLVNPKLRPIRIVAGALGAGLPARDLFVSPNHRILVRSVIAHRMFGAAEVFVPAKKLVGIDGIDAVIRPVGLRYYHLLLDRHEVVTSNMAQTESFYLGPQAIEMMGAQARESLRLCDRSGRKITHVSTARPTITRAAEVSQLIARHQKNAKHLYSDALPPVCALSAAAMSV